MISVDERTAAAPVGAPDSRGTGPRDDAGPGLEPMSFVWRVRHAVVCALLTAFALSQSAGSVVSDTKLDLVVDPLRFLARGLHLWDPLGASGQLQNQAYGYLFPMGPFFVAGRALDVPEWVVQRLWWALVLCTAYTGVVALARRLGVGSGPSQLLAGLAFALSPHVLTVLGPVSAEAWPMALSAWVLVPLVRTGDPGYSPRHAALRSALAVLAMGGVNAALDAAALLPAVVWFLTRRWDRGLLRLAAWWGLGLVLACLWWLVPLFLLGRYSPPFLDYIESASITTSTTSLVEVLRGTHDWIAYLSASGSTAGLLLLTSGVLVVLTGLLAALGLVGLARRGMPERTWLLVTLGVGTVMLTLGHVAAVDGFGSEALRAALDGPLAPLRNVHKFDVVVRLPLVLGLAFLTEQLGTGRNRVEARANRVLVVAAAAFAVIGSAAPMVTMNVAPPRSFTALPGYWEQTAQWLARANGTGRALLLPGSRFGVYDWGTTNDEPLQALARTPWDVRNAIPLTGTGHTRWLDSIEREVAAGRGGPGLAEALRRGGVRYLVVRNDLDYGSVGATNPVRVHQSLASTAEVSRVATFGPTVGSRGSVTLAYDQFLKVGYPAVEIFEVHDSGDVVSATPQSSVTTIQGGAESLLALGTVGLAPDAASITGGDADGGILTDTPRRRETNFAGGPSPSSATLTAADPLRLSKPRRDYDAGAGSREVVAELRGARSVTASSSAADADNTSGVDQAAMPFSAVDGTASTAWRPAPGRDPRGQWLDIDFGRRVPLDGLRITLTPGSGLRQVTVIAGGRRATTQLKGLDETALRSPVAAATKLRVELGARVSGAPESRPVGIAELTVPGVRVTRTLVVPPSASDSAPSAIAFTTSGRRDACAFDGGPSRCVTGQSTPGEDAAGLDRTFSLAHRQAYTLGVTAAAVPGPALDRAIAERVGNPTTATASSTAVPDPAGSAASAVDGDLGTTWIADPLDSDPSLTVRWSGRRTLTSLTLRLDGAAAATPPTEVAIVTPHGNRLVSVAPDGRVEFARLKTDRVTLHLRAPSLASSFDPAAARLDHLGIGVSEVLIPGVHHVAKAADLAAARARRVHGSCGTGPTVDLDGRQVRTAFSATVDDLRRMVPIRLRVCGGVDDLVLGSGTHRARVAPNSLWSATAVTFTAPGTAQGTAQGTAHGTTTVTSAPVAVNVGRWEATHRSLVVGARSEDTVVTVHENANPGWRATSGGRVLRNVTVDGWQQGYVVPAGPRARVDLVYTPDRWMRAGLGIGMLAALALVAGALTKPSRRRRAAELPKAGAPCGTSPIPPGALPVVGLAVLLLVGGWAGAAAAAAGATLWVGARAAAPVRRALPWLAGALYLAAVVRLSWDPWGHAGYAAGSRLTQWLCLLAVAAAFAVPAARSGAASRREPQRPA